MFGQFLTPDTVDYMVAGYVVITLGIGFYIASLVFRTRKALKEYQLYAQDLDQG